MAYKIPEWLQDLPHGEYTLTQAQACTGRDKATLSRTFKLAGLKKKYGCIKPNGMVEITFLWEGKVHEKIPTIYIKKKKENSK